MRDVYSIYLLFLVAVALRYAFRAINIIRQVGPTRPRGDIEGNGACQARGDIEAGGDLEGNETCADKEASKACKATRT